MALVSPKPTASPAATKAPTTTTANDALVRIGRICQMKGIVADAAGVLAAAKWLKDDLSRDRALVRAANICRAKRVSATASDMLSMAQFLAA